jgi:hypothetical protein
MIVASFVCVLFYFILALATLISAKKRQALIWSDLATPILVVAFWFLVTSSGYGHQSLSHLIEVPIALAISLVLLNVRVFAIDKFSDNYMLNSYSILLLSLVATFLLRTLMPYMPE